MAVGCGSTELTLGAITLGLCVPSAAPAGSCSPFEAAYPVLAWLCRAPNLLRAPRRKEEEATPKVVFPKNGDALPMIATRARRTKRAGAARIHRSRRPQPPVGPLSRSRVGDA